MSECLCRIWKHMVVRRSASDVYGGTCLYVGVPLSPMEAHGCSLECVCNIWEHMVVCRNVSVAYGSTWLIVGMPFAAYGGI